MALLAASSTRFSPRPAPMPMSTWPAPSRRALTSAKSTLMRPGRLMTSVMPLTPWYSTRSAMRKASFKVIFLSTAERRRSFWTTTMASTRSLSFLMPSSAARMRLGPSKLKGRVTTATVRAPSRLAMSATTGRFPFPCRPPCPR